MLEFIVLGQIPGTNYQITFTWLIAVAISAFAVFELLRLRRDKRLVTEPAAED